MTSVSFIGAVGGAGTTRLTVECAAALAADDRDVAVLDAAFATQGLADHVPGRLDPDATAMLAEDRPLEAALVDLPVDAPGDVVACPAHAPFAQLARAKTPEAGERFAERVVTASRRADHVLVDTPPVAANPAVAAATATDRVAIIAPGSERGRDATPPMRDRLLDIGVTPDIHVATRTSTAPAADIAIPEADATAPPTCLNGGRFGEAVVDLAARATNEELGVRFDDGLLSL